MTNLQNWFRIIKTLIMNSIELFKTQKDIWWETNYCDKEIKFCRTTIKDLNLKMKDWENELKDCSQEFTCLNDEMQNDWKITNNCSLKFYMMNIKRNDRNWNTKRTRSETASISWWLSCRNTQRKTEFWMPCCVIELSSVVLNSRINHHFKIILIHQTIEWQRFDWLWYWRIFQMILWNIWWQKSANINCVSHRDVECESATIRPFIINFEIKWKKQCDDVCDVHYIWFESFARSFSSCDVSKQVLKFYHKQWTKLTAKKSAFFKKRFRFE